MRFVFVLGAFLLGLAAVCHPWLLARVFSADGSINEVNRLLVQGVRVVSLLAGLLLIGGGLILRRRSSAAFERYNSAWINLSLLACSTALVLVLTEGLLRRLNPYGVNLYRYSKKYFAEVIAPSPDPEIVYAHTPSYRGFMGDVEVTINARGLRNRETPYEKPAGVFRILCVGDSVTFGWGVPQERTYASRLEALLDGGADGKRVEVINGGVGGYNTTQEAAFLRTEGVKYAPDLILLFFAMNDAVEALQPFRPLEAQASPESLDPGLLWRARMIPVMVSSRFLPSLFGFCDYVSMPRVDYVGAFRTEGQPGWKACQEGILDMVRTARSIQADTVVFMLPAMQNLDATYPFGPIHDSVRQFCARHGIPFYDLLPDFMGLANDQVRVSRFDGHPNAFAHGIVARSVQEKIRDRLGAAAAAPGDEPPAAP